MTCNYLYRDGLCASGAISHERCVGKDNCSHMNPALRVPHEAGTRITTTIGQGTLEDKCARWAGLFCPKHRMFYCAAEGACGDCAIDFDAYMESFTKYFPARQNARRKGKGRVL